MSRRRVFMIRHGSVHERYLDLCYGATDVELSELGRSEMQQAAERLAELPVTHVYHSGLTRSFELAELIARPRNLAPIVAPGLREMHFGAWELQTWESIYNSMPDGLDRLLAEPDRFAPPGGETLFAVRDRVLEWYRVLPAESVIVAVAHGGTIATLRGTLSGAPVAQWFDFVPHCGQMVELLAPGESPGAFDAVLRATSRHEMVVRRTRPPA